MNRVEIFCPILKLSYSKAFKNLNTEASYDILGIQTVKEKKER